MGKAGYKLAAQHDCLPPQQFLVFEMGASKPITLQALETSSRKRRRPNARATLNGVDTIIDLFPIIPQEAQWAWTAAGA